jgi:type II secretory pathway component PulF
MAIYKYRAKKGPQDIIEATIEAHSEKEAVEKVSAMGYIPVHIEEYTQAPLSEGASSDGRTGGRIKSGEITVFSRELATLLKAGVPILNAINIIQEQSENPRLRNILKNIHNALKDGATFSSVLAQYPDVFSPLYIALILTGEDSGALSEALLRIADYRRKQEEILSRFRMALAYPVLMAVVGLATVIFMLTFVMPRLMHIFVNMGQDLPVPTRILISTSHGLRQWWLWVILVLIILLIRRQSKTEPAKLFLSHLKIHLPLFGKIMLKAELGRFSRTLEILIKSGIPILKSIEAAIPVVNNEIIKERLKTSYQELEQGGSFGRSLKNSKLFPLFISNLIIVGEASGKLADALSEVATSYERDTDEAIKIMTNLLEPLMILVIGLVVGFIVVAMLLPLFEINVMVR